MVNKIEGTRLTMHVKKTQREIGDGRVTLQLHPRTDETGENYFTYEDLNLIVDTIQAGVKILR